MLAILDGIQTYFLIIAVILAQSAPIYERRPTVVDNYQIKIFGLHLP